jgi:hypothetical protein
MTTADPANKYKPPDIVIAITRSRGIQEIQRRSWHVDRRTAPKLITTMEQLRAIHDRTYVPVGTPETAAQWHLFNEARTLEQFGHIKLWKEPTKKKRRKARKKATK